MENPFLILAAALSATAAMLHVGCIVFGASWYRFFGAGEHMVKLWAAGSPIPALITAGIAAVLALWALFALSAAGVIVMFPFIRLALCCITAVFLLRGVAGFGFAAWAPSGHSVAFWCWSSIVCLSIGALYLVGTVQVWQQLSRAAV